MLHLICRWNMKLMGASDSPACRRMAEYLSVRRRLFNSPLEMQAALTDGAWTNSVISSFCNEFASVFTYYIITFYFIFLFKCIFWVLDIGVSTNMHRCSSCKKMCAPLTTSTLSVLHFKSAQIGFFVELASEVPDRAAVIGGPDV